MTISPCLVFESRPLPEMKRQMGDKRTNEIATANLESILYKF